MIGRIIGLIIVGAIVGALGRLFHPGRDPMPIWTDDRHRHRRRSSSGRPASIGGILGFVLGVVIAVVLVALVGGMYGRRGATV